MSELDTQEPEGNSLARRIGYAVIWLGLISYAALYAPPAREETWPIIFKMLGGDTSVVDPSVFAVFNLLGVIPGMFAALLLSDAVGRRLPAWPFALGSCFGGAFAMMPYLILRGDNRDVAGAPGRWVRFFDSRPVGIALCALTFGLVAFGLFGGSWEAYTAMWQIDPLVNVMTADFIVLVVLLSAYLPIDMRRRGLRPNGGWELCVAVPLLGPALYFALRPTLATAASLAASPVQTLSGAAARSAVTPGAGRSRSAVPDAG